MAYFRFTDDVYSKLNRPIIIAAGNVIFNNVLEDLKPYVGLGIRQYVQAEHVYYFDSVKPNLVDYTDYETSNALFVTTGFSYYLRFTNSINLEHILNIPLWWG